MFSAELSDVGLYGSMTRFGDLGVHAVIDLRRSFSPSQLEQAVQAAIDAFPVLGCCYEERLWRDQWRVVNGPISDAIHVVETDAGDIEAQTAAWARRPIDSSRERPIRLVSLQRDGGCRLILSLTHLAVDGGGVAAVGHVLGAQLYGVAPSVPVDSARSVGRALAGLRWYHLPVLARDMAKTLLLPLQTLGAAKRRRPFAADPAGEATWRHVAISASEVAAIKQRCRPQGASVNDALIAALARVAAGRSGRGPLAVLYTMDLRRYAGAPRLTAANTSSILTAIVPRNAVGDLATAARAVSKITTAQRRGLAGPAFILGPLALGLGAPHALARRITRWLHPVLIDLPLSRGLVFTNVGRLDEGLVAFGEDIERIRAIGPNIRGIDVPAVVAFGFRGELQLELFGPPGLAAEALEELERELRAALELD